MQNTKGKKKETKGEMIIVKRRARFWEEDPRVAAYSKEQRKHSQGEEYQI